MQAGAGPPANTIPRMPHTRTGFVARVSFMSPSRDRASRPLSAMSPVTEVSIETTPIPGVFVVRMPIHEDGRGWFKEGSSAARARGQGFPDVSRSCRTTSRSTPSRGVTRGIHAEPWDKYISLATGGRLRRVVDLAAGRPRAVETVELTRRAIFVRGGRQQLPDPRPRTVYTYLVNEHWSPDAEYHADPASTRPWAIDWPIPPDVEISGEGPRAPALAESSRCAPRGPGARRDGQLGRALAAALPDARSRPGPIDLDAPRRRAGTGTTTT